MAGIRTHNKTGTSLIELMMLVSVVAIIFASGSAVVFRHLKAGADLINYERTRDLANQLIEIRRATGRFPDTNEIKALGVSEDLVFTTKEEKYTNGLIKAVAVVHCRNNNKRKVKLVTLVRK